MTIKLLEVKIVWCVEGRTLLGFQCSVHLRTRFQVYRSPFVNFFEHKKSKQVKAYCYTSLNIVVDLLLGHFSHILTCRSVLCRLFQMQSIRHHNGKNRK
jgi:hypothetical protein